MGQSNYDFEYDVVVVGSGNGGMTCAITAHEGGAEALVVEKSDFYGGTSASSGGGVWIPNNRYAKEAGVEDTPEEALTYIRHVSPEGISDDLIKTYVEQGPRMIDFLHENTRVRYRNLEYYPDYFPHDPGGKFGNRSMEPEPLHASQLGEEFKRLQPQHPGTQMPFGINFTQVEGALILGAVPGWKQCAMKLVSNYLFDWKMRFRTLRDGRLTMGNAGISRLRLSMQDRNIPLWLRCNMEQLILSEGGRVEGIAATREGQPIRIKARKAVVLAAGGFERNQEMREQYLPKPTQTEWSAANLHNTGEAIQAALAVGAQTKQMDWAWWFTTVNVPGHDKAQMSQVEKSMPGNYTVNKDGKRFSNESQNYVTFVEEIFRKTQAGKPCVPCYMIFDADFRRNRPVCALVQGKFFPDWMVPKSWWKPEFLSKANTLRELAEKIGVDADGLEETQRKVNEYARTGKDLDFQRGDSVYDRYYGDPSVQPNPNLGPIEKPPFYAMAMHPGEMGTAGGMVIDSSGRVLNDKDEPIEGLYACGNCTQALLPNYPGPGATLGPAMTFGYLAARHITGADA